MLTPLTIKRSVAVVSLSDGYAIIDATDWPTVSLHRWTRSDQGYATRKSSRKLGKPRNVLMHRQVFGNPQSSLDHINGNRLDNRRSNLRPATCSQNLCNRGPRRGSESGLKGVSRNGRIGWAAVIKANGIKKYLGTFRTPEAAADAYNAAANELHGEFARTNR